MVRQKEANCREEENGCCEQDSVGRSQALISALAKFIKTIVGHWKNTILKFKITSLNIWVPISWSFYLRMVEPKNFNPQLVYCSLVKLPKNIQQVLRMTPIEQHSLLENDPN